MPARFTVTLGLLAAAVACEEPDRAVWEGELVTVTSSDDIQLCGGTIGFLDRFAGHVYGFWTGETPPADFQLRFDLRDSNGTSRRGGARADEHFAWISDQRILVHELGHIVVGWDDGASASSLSEGIAEALGPADPAVMWGPPLDHPLDYAFLAREDFLYSDGELSARYYGPSAKLVRFLIATYGVPTVREAYRTARDEDASDEIEVAYVAAFGEGIEQAFDDYMVAPQCALQAWECSDAVVAVRELPVSIERIDDCTDDADVVGMTAADAELWFPVHQFVVDVPEDTTVVIDTTDNARVQRMACVEVCDVDVPPDSLEWLGGSIDERNWGGGRVSVTVWPDDPALPFSMSIRVAD
jgi:hypothetical protein